MSISMVTLLVLAGVAIALLVFKKTQASALMWASLGSFALLNWGFEISSLPKTLVALPEGSPVSITLLTLLWLLKKDPDSTTKKLIYFLSRWSFALLVLYTTFPWSIRGSMGYGLWVLHSLSLVSFAYGVTQITSEKKVFQIGFGFIVTVLAVAFLLGTASTTHIMGLVALIAPVGVLGIILSLLGSNWFKTYGLLWIGLSIGLLIPNAIIRYVPNPESIYPISEKTLYYLAGLVFLFLPWFFKIKAQNFEGKRILGALSMMLIATLMSLSVYFYPSDTEAASDSPEVDYYSL